MVSSFCLAGTMAEAWAWHFDLPPIFEVGVNKNILEMRKLQLVED